jgi:hypothetical protein
MGSLPKQLAITAACLTLLGPAVAQAQTKDAKLVTCSELLAMDAAAQKSFLQEMVAASADADTLDDLVADDSSIGPVIQVCEGNPSMLAMEAVVSLKN